MNSFKVTALFVILLYPQFSHSQEAEPSRASSGLIDINYYYDSRAYTTLTINTLANLSHRLQYFSLVDFGGSPKTAKELDVSSFYTEQNLRYQVYENSPWSLSSQWVAQSNQRNDLLRAGILTNFSELKFTQPFLNGTTNFISINLFPLQIDHMDGFNWQIEYFYRFQILPSFFRNHVYLSGFADQNISDRVDSTWIVENQIGIRFYDNFYVVAEHRFNGSLENDATGLGLGLEYTILF